MIFILSFYVAQADPSPSQGLPAFRLIYASTLVPSATNLFSIPAFSSFPSSHRKNRTFGTLLFHLCRLIKSQGRV